MTYQTVGDKKFQYYGSARMYYSGLTLGSANAWSTITWSGANGFGANQNLLSQRMMIISSGTSVVEFSFDAGTTRHGALHGGEALTFDGINRSGIDLRSASASQFIRLWAW